MADQEKAQFLKSNTSLVEITEVQSVPGSGPQGSHLKVVIAWRNPHRSDELQGTWYLEKGRWPDDALVPVVRSFFHGLCKDIAAATDDWHLSDEQVKAAQFPEWGTKRRP